MMDMIRIKITEMKRIIIIFIFIMPAVVSDSSFLSWRIITLILSVSLRPMQAYITVKPFSWITVPTGQA